MPFPVFRVGILAWLAASSVRPTLRYKPAPDDERPVVTQATIQPEGNDFVFRLRFNRPPWGPECKTRCANASFYLDTDADTGSGLKLGPKDPLTGTDLLVTLQGVREYRDVSADTLLKVKVRLLAGTHPESDDGQVLAEMDHRRDSDRVETQGVQVTVRVDATHALIPAGRKMRVVYQPPGARPVVGHAQGIQRGGRAQRQP